MTFSLPYNPAHLFTIYKTAAAAAEAARGYIAGQQKRKSDGRGSSPARENPGRRRTEPIFTSDSVVIFPLVSRMYTHSMFFQHHTEQQKQSSTVICCTAQNNKGEQQQRRRRRRRNTFIIHNEQPAPSKIKAEDANLVVALRLKKSKKKNNKKPNAIGMRN